MAWKDQELPFDVSNLRAIMERRDILDQETNRKKLCAFLAAAAAGKYYKPMEAVGRLAAIETASSTLGDDSLLGVLAREVRDLRSVVGSATASRQRRPPGPGIPTIKQLMPRKPMRSQLYSHFLDSGGAAKGWASLLREHVPRDEAETMGSWSDGEWRDFVAERGDAECERIGTMPKATSEEFPEWSKKVKGTTKSQAVELDAEFILRVKERLPDQPWPKGIHQEVADALDAPSRRVQAAIQELIRRGDVYPQIDGVVYEPRDRPAGDKQESTDA